MENRSVIIAEYRATSTFVIPEGIDIYNKDQVLGFAIKYDVLYIDMKDGREIKVEPYISATQDDFKYPEHLEIEGAFDAGVDEDYKDEDYVS
jgi:hypothetical protein